MRQWWSKFPKSQQCLVNMCNKNITWKFQKWGLKFWTDSTAWTVMFNYPDCRQSSKPQSRRRWNAAPCLPWFENILGTRAMFSSHVGATELWPAIQGDWIKQHWDICWAMDWTQWFLRTSPVSVTGTRSDKEWIWWLQTSCSFATKTYCSLLWSICFCSTFKWWNTDL